MRDCSPVVFRGDHNGRLQDLDSVQKWAHPIFFASEFAQAKLYARKEEPVAVVLQAARTLDLTDIDVLNKEHMAFIRELEDSFDDWTCRVSGEPRSAYDCLVAGDLYDYEGDGTGRRWHRLFRIAFNMGYDAVCALDCTDGTHHQPSPVWVVSSPGAVRRATLGEELVARLDQQPWTDVAAWLEKDHPSLIERVRRMNLLEEEYRSDQLRQMMPAREMASTGLKGKPQPVYRGLPQRFDIRPGDWVAMKSSYAAEHARDEAGETGVVKTLPAVDPEEIFWAGTDCNEFFYAPAAWRKPGLDLESYFRFLTPDQVRLLCDGELSSLTRYAPQLKAIEAAVMAGFDEERTGIDHGPEHWQRVRQHAIVTSRSLGIDPLVPVVFALVHDSQREDEGLDPEHGPRAAEFVTEHRYTLFAFLSNSQIDELVIACRDHSEGLVHGPEAVQACWDADRLDLGRVGVTPDPRYLCTDHAKRDDVIEHACKLNGHGKRNRLRFG